MKKTTVNQSLELFDISAVDLIVGDFIWHKGVLHEVVYVEEDKVNHVIEVDTLDAFWIYKYDDLVTIWIVDDRDRPDPIVFMPKPMLAVDVLKIVDWNDIND